jgi:pyruvate/2-oxoglutarate dehydrogenase complex dihydrolipoamide dehydrogenase (E3) component
MESVSSTQLSKKTDPEEYDLVVLGSGAGSKLTAWTLAKQGKRVAVIERKYIAGSRPTRTLSETRGFLKALVETDGDRILGFAAFGVDAGEIMSSVQIAMIAGLPYTALRDAILAHPTLLEGLAPLFSSVPSVSKSRSSNPGTNLWR